MSNLVKELTERKEELEGALRENYGSDSDEDTVNLVAYALLNGTGEKREWEEELERINEFLDQLPNNPHLIPDTEFEEYAQELAQEIGGLPRGQMDEWPFRHIDWEQAADALKQDFREVEWDGTTYYYRE